MKLLFFTPTCRIGQSLLMDRAYEGDKMRAIAKKLGYNPVVPPKKNRIDPWEYDRMLYKRRNEVEQFLSEESNASGGFLLAMTNSILSLLALSCSPCF